MREGFVLAAGALAFVLAFPSEVVTDGLGFLGPVVLGAVFWFTARHRAWIATLGGAFWVIIVTLGSHSWLAQFHPLALPLVLLFQIPWYAAFFALSSVLWRRFAGTAVWFQALAWTIFEFLRIQGFFAFPYGALATAFWAFPITFQSADLIGTSGLTFLLAWSSAWLAAVILRRQPWPQLRLNLILGLGVWTVNLGYGLWRLAEPGGGTLWRVALVQPNRDPWKGGAAAYESALDRLEALSRRVIEQRPDVVVWPETAFVPSVEFHSRYHENPDSLRLVRRLETFLGRQTVPFLLGNDHREKTPAGTVADYNAVLVWDDRWTGRYEKKRLVPFTESFPYRDILPWVYDWLRSADTHFWEPGRDLPPTIVDGVRVGTPICFEDAFAASIRVFAEGGARMLVNVTNDSWAPGVASRMQHLSLAVFRTVETRIPLVRAGNDGATAVVSPRGELVARLPVGTEDALVADVELGLGRKTLYTQWGDWICWMGVLVLIGGLWRPSKGPAHPV